MKRMTDERRREIQEAWAGVDGGADVEEFAQEVMRGQAREARLEAALKTIAVRCAGVHSGIGHEVLDMATGALEDE